MHAFEKKKRKKGEHSPSPPSSENDEMRFIGRDRGKSGVQKTMSASNKLPSKDGH
jgi:hypothetical protein